jgi:predicted O-linked N-acetylglucosamine transferase (SPINDLY family)
MQGATLIEQARQLLRQGALDDAARCLQQVLRADAADAAALYHLAQIACMQGRLEDGIALAQRSLAADFSQGRAHNLLGQALHQAGRTRDALASFDAAIAASPNLADAHGNRGDALAALGDKKAALASYDRATALDPESFANWLNRGAALFELQQFPEAVGSFERALAIEPDSAQAHFNRGNALAALARDDDALAAFEAALALAPAAVEALHNRGCVLSKVGRYTDAIASFERVLAIEPRHGAALSELAHCHLFTCDWEGLARSTRRLDTALADPNCVVPPFTLLELAIEPQRLRTCNARYVAQKVPPQITPFVHRASSRRSGKLRLAYLGDFNPHPVSYLTAGLFERHDRSAFDVLGVALGRDDGSAIRARIAKSCDRFFDATSLTDGEVANRLQELGVDIAVDLVGHTENARPGLLAHRPAPVQVSYLGYLGSMAADFIDYVIADATALPFSQQPFYAERIVHLPGCFMVQDRQQAVPHSLSRADVGLPSDGFVFCSFNHSYKIREPVFEIWMRLLREIPGSVLWLLSANPQAAANLRRAAERRTIDPQRLIFAERADLAYHLDRQRLADLFLDTVPYNAGATASAALWAGVPMLTCLGTSLVGRMAASMLRAMELPELATGSLAAYEETALTLARDPDRLQSVRRTIEQNKLRGPLFDTERTTRHIEAAYRTMWDAWQRDEPRRPFAVTAAPVQD